MWKRNPLLIIVMFVIVSSIVEATTTTFTNPSTVVSSSYTGGTIVWDNPSNAVSFNAAYASATLTGALGTDSAMLNSTHYGFAIPAGSTINGIVVSCYKDCDFSSEVRDVKAYLLKNYATVGSNLPDTGAGWTTTAKWVNYSNMTGLWGTTWTAEEINSPGFGFGVSTEVYAGGGDDLPQIDVCQIMVNYTQGDSIAPTYSLNSTNSTLNGTFVSHNLFWSEENISTNLSHYSFGWCNDTFTYNNGSQVVYPTQLYEDFDIATTDLQTNWNEGAWTAITSTTYCVNDDDDDCANSTLADTAFYYSTNIDTSACDANSVRVTANVYELNCASGENLNLIVSGNAGTTNTTVTYLTGASATGAYTINMSLMGNVSSQFRLGFTTLSTDAADKDYYMIDDLRVMCSVTTQQYRTVECSDAGASANLTFDPWVRIQNQYNWSNVTKQVPVAVNSTVKWCIRANDSLGNVNSSGCSNGFIFSYNTTASSSDTSPPTNVITQDNITVAPSLLDYVLFSSQWTDNAALSHYIFQWNASGLLCNEWANDSGANFGSGGWANVTKQIPAACSVLSSTSSIGYRFWANDTSNNNASTQDYNILSGGTCSCQSPWIINDGSDCTLTTACTTTYVWVGNGKLRISSTGTLIAPQGIRAKAGSFYTQNGAKIKYG